MREVSKAGLVAALFALLLAVNGRGEQVVQGDDPETSVEERLFRLERAIDHGDSPLVTFDDFEGTLHLKSLEWGLLIEAEGSYRDRSGDSESDLVLATVEFTTDAEVNDWLSGHVCVLWEEDDTEENNLDAGYIVVGRAFYAQAGKYYFPYGNFETAFISDSLTLELAEINRSSILAGYGNNWFGLCAGAFKGDDEDTVEEFYSACGISIGETAEVGVYWLSDLLETDGLADLNDDGLDQKTGGAGGYANLYLGPFMVCAEAVSALSDYDIAGDTYTPLAYNAEVSVVVAEHWTVGAKVEGSEDFYTEFDGTDLGGKFHDNACGAVISYAFHDNATVSAEYLRLVSLDDGENGHLGTVQLALEI